MDIGRQPDASCDQRNCHDESQPIYDHATPIIVLLDIALVLGKAQDRRNVRITITDELPPPCRPFRFGASRPNSDDAMYVIARLKRSEDQVTTFRHHHTDKGYRTGPTCKFHAAVGKYGRLVRLVMMRRAQLSLPRPSRSPIKNLQGFIAGWISAKLKKIHLSGLPVQKYIGDGGSRPGGPPIAEGHDCSKMAPASTGRSGGMPRPGPCWGTASPAYSLGRWNCLTRFGALFVLKLEIRSEDPRPLTQPVRLSDEAHRHA
jgi:hypothetical protein